MSMLALTVDLTLSLSHNPTVHLTLTLTHNPTVGLTISLTHREKDRDIHIHTYIHTLTHREKERDIHTLTSIYTQRERDQHLTKKKITTSIGHRRHAKAHQTAAVR